MKEFVVFVPVLAGKIGAWKSLSTEMIKSDGLKDIMRKGGATRVRAWAFETPSGSFGVVHHEGPSLDPEKFMAAMFNTDDPIMRAALAKTEEIHGPMRPDQPPPIGQPVFDFSLD